MMVVLPRKSNNFFWAVVTGKAQLILALIYWSNQLEPWQINLNEPWLKLLLHTGECNSTYKRLFNFFHNFKMIITRKLN